MKAVHLIAFLLLAVGGLNWGLVGLFDLNVVEVIFGGVPSLVAIVYVLIGLSALFELFTHKKHCRICSGSA